ncbi:MAG: InlB B-repeat-containing protein [Eubacteriaceae bacterium]|nr:InlB B-repeat-containing protein [Eubacteriaceae bacterium]
MFKKGYNRLAKVLAVILCFTTVMTFALYGTNAEADGTPGTGQTLEATIKDSGGNDVVTLGAGSSAVLKYNSSKIAGDVYTMDIQASFASNATDKQVTVKLPAGMKWVSYVTDAYKDDLKANGMTYTSTANTAADNENGTAYTYERFGNTGSVVYKCSGNAKEVYIECQIAIDPQYHLSEISNAVQVTLSSSEGDITDNLEKATTEPYAASIYSYNQGTWYAKPDTPYHPRSSYYDYYLNNNAKSIEPVVSALYKTASFKVTVSDTDAVMTCTDPAWTMTDGGNGVYTFSAENIYIGGGLNLPYSITFPSEKFKVGDKVTVTRNEASTTLYDGSSASYNGGNTTTYKIAPDNYVWAGYGNNDSALAGSPAQHRSSYFVGPDGKIYLDTNDYMGMISGYQFGNAGTADSAPQMLELNFDHTAYSVKALMIYVIKDNPVTSIEYKINGKTEWQTAAVDFTSAGSHTISYKTLGVSYSDDITAVRYNVGVIPSSTYYSWSGLRVFGTVKRANATADSTLELYNKDDSSITTGINHMYTYTNAAAGDIYITQSHNYIKQGGSKFTFSGVMKGLNYWYEGCQIYATKNPILYIRSETGCEVSDFKIKYDVTGDDVTDKCEISTFRDSTGCLVYKIDTKKLGADEYYGQTGGVVVNKDGNVVNPSFSFSYSIQTEKTTPEKVYNYVDMLFGYDPTHTVFGSATWWRTYLDTTDYDTYSLNKDGGGAMMRYGYHTYYGGLSPDYYQIKNIASINVWNEAKKTTDSKWRDTEYDSKDSSTIIDVGAGGFDMRTVVQNNCGIATGKGTVVYQPIPKEGEDWGKLTAGIDSLGKASAGPVWTGKLTEAVKNPDSSKWKITYGAGVSPSDNYDTLETEQFRDAADVTDWSQVNCVRIEAIDDMEVDAEQIFDMTVVKTSYSEEGYGTDIVSPIFYRKCTNSDGARYSAVVDPTTGASPYAFKLSDGSIKGTLWNDVNGNGTKDPGEPVIDGTKDSWKVIAYKAGDTSETQAAADIGSNGEYELKGLLGTEKYYDLAVENKLSGEKYVFTKTGTSAESNKFSDISETKDNSLGTAAAATAVYEPGTEEMKDDGSSYDGRYNIGITKIVTLKYDGNTNTAGSPPEDADSPYPYGSEVKVKDSGSLTKEHYTFTGWSTNADGGAVMYAPGETFNITADTVLYAQWQLNKHAVKYDRNAADSGTPPAGSSADFGSTVKVAGNTDLARTGYTFDGWNTKADGKGNAYKADDEFTMPDEDVTLYAQWKVRSHDVKYDGNGSTSGTVPADTNNPYDYGTFVKVLGNTDLSRTGYTFSGWNTKADGKGTAYKAGDTFSMPDEDVTLYAQWDVDIPVIPPTPLTGTVTVTKNTLTQAGKTADVSGTFFFTLFNDPECTKAAVRTQSAAVINGAAASAVFTNVPAGVYYAAETNADGTKVITVPENTDKYTGYGVDGNDQKITISSTGRMAAVTITNRYTPSGGKTPDKPAKPVTPGSRNHSGGSPDTGDGFGTGAPVLLMLLGAFAAFVCLRKRA